MTTPSAYERRKAPEKVRAALIEAAATLIAEHGLPRLTIDAVAKLAGVTKGGLFHHFASKDELIQGVNDSIIDLADDTIAAAMAADPEPYGSFTRAYLAGVLAGPPSLAQTSAHALCLAMLADPKLHDMWFNWINTQVEKHAATDDNSPCALVRLATDGIWLNSLRHGGTPPPQDPEILSRLDALTRPGP